MRGPKVTIGILTYNHAIHIAETLESVLKQKLDFEFQILVSDDCSTDRTVEIVQSYCSQFPRKIHLLTNQVNRGVFQNAFNAIPYCTGQYLVLMDGDDKWTYDLKLQKQIDFLDSNLDYVGCFHDATINSSEGVKGYFKGLKSYSQFNIYKDTIYPWDIVERMIIPTGSLVFRNVQFIYDSEAFKFVNLSLIWLFQLLIIRDSKFKYFNETWSVYNNHTSGITKKVASVEFTKTNIKILKKLLYEPYYRNIKHHVFKSLVKESTDLYFLQRAEYSLLKRYYEVFKIWKYGQRSNLHRCISLLKR